MSHWLVKTHGCSLPSLDPHSIQAWGGELSEQKKKVPQEHSLKMASWRSAARVWWCDHEAALPSLTCSTWSSLRGSVEKTSNDHKGAGSRRWTAVSKCRESRSSPSKLDLFHMVKLEGECWEGFLMRALGGYSRRGADRFVKQDGGWWSNLQGGQSRAALVLQTETSDHEALEQGGNSKRRSSQGSAITWYSWEDDLKVSV